MSDRPTPWQNFTGQYIAGAWRSGSARKVLENRNPYDNALLTELSLGDVSDLDDAYQAAATAQKAWAQTLPNERSALFMRAVSVLEARHEEIVD